MRLPYAVDPDSTAAQANSHEGTVVVTLAVDMSPVSQRADAGSKPSLLAQALNSVEGRRPELSGADRVERVQGEGIVRNASQLARGVEGEETLPEDRFHLKLPEGTIFDVGLRLMCARQVFCCQYDQV